MLFQTMPKWTTIIAIGSNMGDQERNLRLAAAELQQLSTAPIQASSIWWSKPEGFNEDVAEFCNAVILVKVELTAELLLERLKEIERTLGRQRSKGEGYLSRTIDLDIVDYDLRYQKSAGLELPHPRAHQRRFVLVPLQEIAPGYRFPGVESDLEELIERAPSNPMRKSIPLVPLA